jgi:hypothetical protein
MDGEGFINFFLKGVILMEFNLDQAIQALHTVCRQYKGTADDHDYLKSVL